MLTQIITVDGPIRPFAVALTLADRLNVRSQFWGYLLAGITDPPSANATAALAVRTYVETRLSLLGPADALSQVEALLSETGSWTNLGLSCVTDASVGQALTAELKSDLSTALVTFARTWLTGLAADVTTEATP